MSKPIAPQLGFTRMSSGVLAVRAAALAAGTTNNIAFPDLPVDPAIFDQAVKNLQAANVDALDGGNMALAAQAAARKVVIGYFRILAAYVVVKSAGDMAIFVSSGLIPITPTSSTSVGLPPPAFRKLFRGPHSGQISFYIKALVGAYSYLVQYAIDGLEPALWTEIRITNVKSATIVSGLTPGTRYMFQVRALGAIDYTDWSDSVTIMCT